MTTAALRPMGLGELLDRSINFWRAHWKPLFRLLVAFQLVQLILLKAAQLFGRWAFPLMSGSPEALDRLKTAPQESLPQLAGFMAVLVAMILVTLLVSQVSGVAVTHYAWSRLTQRGLPGPGDAFRHAAAKLAVTVGAYALSLGWSLGVMVLLQLPGALLLVGAAVLAASGSAAGALVAGGLGAGALLLGLLVLVLLFVIRFILLSQVIATEELGPLGAFRRTGALSSGRVAPGPLGFVKLRLTILVTIIGGILLLISVVMTVPTFVAGAIYGASFQPGQGVDVVVPAVVLVPIEILQTIGGAVVAPLYVIFQVMFYADMRARREGLDLELQLTRRPA